MPLINRKYYQGNIYYITASVNKFVKIFTEKRYLEIILKNVDFYRHKFGFKLLAYVIIPDHLHLLIVTKQNRVKEVSNMMRDFKRVTSRLLSTQMEKDNKTKWLQAFRLDIPSKRNGEYKIWQERYDDFTVYSSTMITTKINRIHHNPVKKGLVQKPEDYLYSSARNYAFNDHSIIKVDTDFLI